MYTSVKKRILIKEQIAQKCDHVQGKVCEQCVKKQMFVDLMADSNIPIKYWFLKLKDFSGSPIIKDATQNYIDNLKDNFLNGQSLCFVGTYGTGKTYSICSIMKKALISGFSAYYTSLTDIVTYSMDYQYKNEFAIKTTQCDFLAIDEVDSRHMSDSDEAQRLFGSAFEKIIRYRTQNALPTLIATNNSSLEEVFSGQHKRVVESLGSSLKVVAALGKDFRMQNKK
jgi:DNA replication protein DnaC